MPSRSATRRGFTIRPVTADDAPAAAGFYDAAQVALAGPLELMLQTGNAFLAAYDAEGGVRGLVRHWEDEGIAWWDLLVSASPGAGRALVRGVEMAAQDRGIRLVRVSVDEASRLPNVLQRWGYRPVGHTREERDGRAVQMLVLEKRLALLTVREQRRSDAAEIGRLTGDDPWVYEQGSRPGVFVAADGDRVVGVISVKDDRAGTALIAAPALDAAYSGRGLELWMVERAAIYAETNGFHSATLPATAALDANRRALEDRRWFREDNDGAPRYIRRFHDLSANKDHEDWD